MGICEWVWLTLTQKNTSKWQVIELERVRGVHVNPLDSISETPIKAHGVFYPNRRVSDHVAKPGAACSPSPQQPSLLMDTGRKRAKDHWNPLFHL